MIKNQRQYNVTRNNALLFKEALVHARLETPPADIDPVIHAAKIAGMESMLQTLEEDMAEYDALLQGNVEIISLNSLEELPVGLIKARIARKLTQKELADLVGVKPQQIQRWESEDYEKVGFGNLVEIANALELDISECIRLPGKPKSVFAYLKELGLDKNFITSRLASNDALYRLGKCSEVDILAAAAPRLLSIFGVMVSEDEVALLDDRIAKAAAGGRFKLPANANLNKVNAYSVYAKHLAKIVAQGSCNLPIIEIPQTWHELRNALCGNESPTFERLLHGAWDLGIAVLPLRDPGRFHGVSWRFSGRNVIVLKQSSQYSSRWAFDLLHEICHAGEHGEKETHDDSELDATDAQRRESEEEKAANDLAGNVLLGGRAEELFQLVMKSANNIPNRIKKAVENVASQNFVNVSDLANYIAYRVKDTIDWWGTAANLQPYNEDPISVARAILMQRIDVTCLAYEDRILLEQAIGDPIIFN
nr:XRE family transcriptional regulator [uncultured Massilia sp.]